MDEVDLALAIIPVLGIACLWGAARLGIPAILLLLPGGILVGPVLDLVDPEELFGESLYPAVSLAVAVLLFDGGLGLRFDQLERRNVVLRLVTLGVGVTFAIGAFAAAMLFDAPRGVTTLLGAVLVVSGPTVVGPILNQVRPRESVGSILRWEGICIDPIGATLAIVVLGVAAGHADGWAVVGLNLVATAASGIIVGGLGAIIFARALRAHLVPDQLQAVAALGMALAVFGIGNEIRPEGGLFAATVLGVVLANQRTVTVGHIAQFGESLGQVLLALLFVVLGATISLDALADVALPALALTAVLVLVARPLAVWLATVGTPLSWRERAFMIALAPRGIVAAAVSALFTVTLTNEGVDSSVLVPTVFVVIIASVCLYGLAARPVAKLLRITRAEPKGLVMIGAPAWAHPISAALQAHDLVVLHITTDAEEARAATRNGLLVYQGSLDPDELREAAEAIGARQVLATRSDLALDELCTERLAEVVGRANLFQLPAGGDQVLGLGRTRAVRARRVFSHQVDEAELELRARRGDQAVVLGSNELAEPDDLTVARLRTDGAVELVTHATSQTPPAPGEHVVVLRPSEVATPTEFGSAPTSA